jgi:hypothetical protein
VTLPRNFKILKKIPPRISNFLILNGGKFGGKVLEEILEEILEENCAQQPWWSGGTGPQ